MPGNRPDNALQAKVFTVLEADDSGAGNLRTLLGGSEGTPRIYDMGAVPDGMAPPYVVLGRMPLEDWGGYTFSGFEGDVEIHFWTQTGLGKKDAQSIADRLYYLLHELELGLSGYPTISFRCAFNEITVDEDERTYHGVQRYRVKLGGN